MVPGKFRREVSNRRSTNKANYHLRIQARKELLKVCVVLKPEMQKLLTQTMFHFDYITNSPKLILKGVWHAIQQLAVEYLVMQLKQ